MKMRNGRGRGWDFAPAMADHPANELAGAVVVAAVSPKRAKEQKHGVSEGIDLMPQRFARAEEITTNFPINFQDERRFRFVVGVISREKIGEQFAVLETPDRSGLRGNPVAQQSLRTAACDRSLDSRELSTATFRPFSVVSYSSSETSLVNGKQTFEHPGPAIGVPRPNATQRSPAEANLREQAALDRASERFRSVFLRPGFLVVAE